MSENIINPNRVVEIKDITAGAGALGLLGYGMPGVLISLANAGLIQSGSAILSMVIFMGGLAMFTAGLMEWKKGNTYGMAAYASYGLFFFSFAVIFAERSNQLFVVAVAHGKRHPDYWRERLG